MFLSGEILGLIGIALSVYAYVPYYLGIWRGRVKPHFFTWFLWSLMSGICFFAQVADHAGPGAWITGATSILTLTVAITALKYGEKHITRADWIMFILGVSAIPLWVVTNDPLLSVIIVSLVDALAYGPTLRKSWAKPHEEAVQTYVVSLAVFLLGFLALANITWTTALYPATMMTMNIVFIATAMGRRYALRNVS